MSSYPRILINQQALLHNADLLAELCHSYGMTLAAVGKGAAAHADVMTALTASKADYIADSRLENLARLTCAQPRWLLRIAQPSELDELVAGCEISSHSEISTVRLLGQAAARQGKRHKVVLMVDLGDLREGVFFREEEALLALAAAVVAEPALELYGLGANLSCFAGVMPDAANMGCLVRLAGLLRERFRVPLPLVSGGATSNLESLLAEEWPTGDGGVTNLRLGEGLLLAYDSSGSQPLTRLPQLADLSDSALVLEAQLVELQTKPSQPVGRVACNAFGEAVSFPDKGLMRRGVCALGRQDTDLDGLTPEDSRIEILGGSSDHTILDLTHAPAYRVGDVIRFRMSYGAMLLAFTCGYVKKDIRPQTAL